MNINFLFWYIRQFRNTDAKIGVFCKNSEQVDNITRLESFNIEYLKKIHKTKYSAEIIYGNSFIRVFEYSEEILCGHRFDAIFLADTSFLEDEILRQCIYPYLTGRFDDKFAPLIYCLENEKMII